MHIKRGRLLLSLLVGERARVSRRRTGSPGSTRGDRYGREIAGVMPWDEDRYPASMSHLPVSVRRKAIEIANALLEEGYDEGKAIPLCSESPTAFTPRVARSSSGFPRVSGAE